MINIDNYLRTCAFTAQRENLTVIQKRESATIMIPATLDAEDRQKAYLIDSVWTGLRAASRGDWVLAFRCLLQSHYENGNLGGSAHGPDFQDAIHGLQRWVEDTAVIPWQSATEPLRIAARERLAHGHNDTCSKALGGYPCDCGHDNLSSELGVLS